MAEEFFNDVVGLIEATDVERQYLWQEWHKNLIWVDKSLGFMRTVGYINDRPVCVSFIAAIINGSKILFYTPTSVMVDWDMVESWLKNNMPESARKQDGRLNKTDACNAHIVFRSVMKKD